MSTASNGGPGAGNAASGHPNGGGSGEGAGSAMEAMVRKRQMNVDTQPDPGAAERDGELDGASEE